MRYCLLLLGFAFFLYLPSFNNDLFWDDEQFIYNNTYVKAFDVKNIVTQNTIAGAGEISQYYRPLTTLSFAFDYQIWGNNPIGFHLTNTLLHAFAAVLLFLFLTEIGIRKKYALTIAAVFIAHPLQTESVVYANSRGDSQYAFWLFTSLFLFSLLLRTKKSTLALYNISFTVQKWQLLLGTVSTFICAVLAKEIALGGLLLFPAVLLLQKIHTKSKATSKNTRYQFATISLIALSVGAYFLLRHYFVNLGPFINYYAGSEYGDSVLVRIFTFAASLWLYLKLILVPFPLHMERSISVITTALHPAVIASTVGIAVLFLLGLKELQKKQAIWIWFGTYWFFALLGPVSGVLPVNGMFYEHWLYTPLVGVLICCYGMFQLLPKNLTIIILKLKTPILAILFSIYVLLTLRQNYLWGNAIRFYSYTLSHSETARLRNNLAMSYADKGQTQKAVEEYKKSLSITDTYPQTHYNLAQAYVAQGQITEALVEYTAALEIDPHFMYAYQPLILLYAQQKNQDLAETYLQQLEALVPGNESVAALRKTAQSLLQDTP